MLAALSAIVLGVVALTSLLLAQMFVPKGWETFTSDLVVGVLTTGVLGVLLWLFTRKIDSDARTREATQLARLRWAVVVRRIAVIVNSEDFEDKVLDAADLGPVARQLVTLLQDEPLTEWNSVLDLHEISRVTSALQQLETTAALGRKLNHEIRFAFNSSERRSSQPLKAFQSAFIGEALGFDLSATLHAFKISGRRKARFLEDVDRLRSGNLQQRITEYALMRHSAEHLVDQLRTRALHVDPSNSDIEGTRSV